MGVGELMSRFRESFPADEDAIRFICKEIGIPVDQVVGEEAQAWLIGWFFQGYNKPIDQGVNS